jgi:two-component system, chemotaxis family, response regulator Rcp1
MKKAVINMLMVEDDPGDVDLAREALRSVGENNIVLNIVEDGDKALGYLQRKEPYEKASTPDLILLDLNLPRKDGREFLHDIKAIEGLKSIPIIVFTTSTAARDVEEAYRLGANCYITKPFEFAQYKKIFQAICDFWFNIVSLNP